jgi:hypothetical protein
MGAVAGLKSGSIAQDGDKCYLRFLEKRANVRAPRSATTWNAI